MAPADDPVGVGLIASLGRPGGNVTGLSGTGTELAAKTLELIREAVPSAKRVALLANADDAFTQPFVRELDEAGSKLHMEIRAERIRISADFEGAFARIAEEQSQA